MSSIARAPASGSIYAPEVCQQHIEQLEHAESAARWQAAHRGWQTSARAPDWLARETPLLPWSLAARVHQRSYLAQLQAQLPEHGEVALDPDTWLSAKSLLAARAASGSLVDAIDRCANHDTHWAMVLSRPPGHHAEANHAMGFCLLNHVVIAAQYALDHHYERVAIVDFDVHHGNGTQAMVWDRADILYVSSHQQPLYPGTGQADERGATDNVLNLPLPPGSPGSVMRQVYTQRVMGRLRAFRPELIIVSAGFDAHRDDPLAGLAWQTADYGWLAQQLSQLALALGVPMVSILEGGYNLTALQTSVSAYLDGHCR